MKSGADLDYLAEVAMQRYGLLLTQFELALNNALASRDWKSTRARERLRNASYDMANTWLEAESAILSDLVTQTGEVAVRDVDEAVGVLMEPLSQLITGHLDAIRQDLEHALRLQIERDIATLSIALRDAALRSVLVGRGASVRASRSRGAQIGTAPSGVVFSVPDRAGRKWASTKMMRSLWRHALVLAGAEAALLRMEEIGLDLAVVTHPDRNHENSDRRVALAEGAAGEPWPVVREEVFHPNTHAQLAPVLEAS